jgi:hypothetical protein
MLNFIARTAINKFRCRKIPRSKQSKTIIISFLGCDDYLTIAAVVNVDYTTALMAGCTTTPC